MRRHKLHCISNRTFVIIEEDLVRAFNLDEPGTWAEEIQTNDGILLKFQRESGPDKH